MLSCDTHLYLCNIELRENSRVTADIADNWEHTWIHMCRCKGWYLKVLHPAMWRRELKKSVDLFIRILIRGAACCDSTRGCKVNINAANFSHRMHPKPQVLSMLLDASMQTTRGWTTQLIIKYYSDKVDCRRRRISSLQSLLRSSNLSFFGNC